MKHLLGQLGKELRATTGGLPGTFWYLWTGTLVNRLGAFVAPFLALYLTLERGFREEEAGLVVSLHGAGSVVAGLVGGMLADRVGRRKTLLAGLWLGAASMVGLGLSRTTWQICVMAFLLGLMGELYRPAVSAAIADVVRPEDRSRAYGLLYWVVNVGFALSLPLAGLASHLGFLTLFLADACSSFLYGLIVWWKVPETRPAGTSRQKDAALPLPSLAPFQDPMFLTFAFPVLLTALLFSQATITLPLDLKSQGMSLRTFGLVMAVNGVFVVLLQPFAGRVMGGMRRASALSLASLLTGVGFGLHVLGANAGLAALAVGVWSLGEIAQSPVASAVVADLAPADKRGTYQGAYYTLWALSACLGPYIGSRILGHHGPYALWGACLATGLFASGWHLAAAEARRRRLHTPRLTQSEVSAALD